MNFDEEFLLLQEQFANSLKNIPIEDKDYIHAETVFDKFGCINLGHYHDLYLTGDALFRTEVL